jgi:hypothetical protein
MIKKKNYKLEFLEMLKTEKSRKTLINYYEMYILSDIEKINELKRVLHELRVAFKKCGSDEISAKYHDIYEKLKAGKISYDEAFKMYTEIKG